MIEYRTAAAHLSQSGPCAAIVAKGGASVGSSSLAWVSPTAVLSEGGASEHFGVWSAVPLASKGLRDRRRTTASERLRKHGQGPGVRTQLETG